MLAAFLIIIFCDYQYTIIRSGDGTDADNNVIIVRAALCVPSASRYCHFDILALEMFRSRKLFRPGKESDSDG